MGSSDYHSLLCLKRHTRTAKNLNGPSLFRESLRDEQNGYSEVFCSGHSLTLHPALFSQLRALNPDSLKASRKDEQI